MMVKNKKIFKSIIVFMLIFSMIVPGFAEENYKGKEEVVYGILNGDGSVDEIYVVNIFDGNGKITDYGDYSKVRNMTTNDEILVDGNQITINNTADKLYYEGTLKKNELPWDIDIKYYIDDIEYTAEDIAGKSGALTIKIKIDENKDVNDNFYENYAIQALVLLDSNKAKDIISKQATIANVGKDKQLAYTILPGKGADITIKANVKDFEMESISINGINLNLDIEIDDARLKDKVDELLNGVNKIDNGAHKIKDSASQLKEGTGKLALGVKELEDGSEDLEKGILSLRHGIIQIEKALDELNSKSKTLTKGSAEFKAALMEVQRALSDISLQVDKTEELINASSQIKNSIDGLNSSMELLKKSTGYSQYKASMQESGLDIDNLKTENTKAINTINDQINGLKNSYNKVKDMPGYESQAKELKVQIGELDNIVKLLNGNNGAISGSEKYLNKVSESISQIHKGTLTLQSHYSEFDKSISLLAASLNEMVGSMPQLAGGINVLVEKYTELDNGINEYTDGLARIVIGYKDIVEGTLSLDEGSQNLRNGSGLLYENMFKISEGTSDLYDGTVDLADGTDEFKNKTSNIDKEVENGVDDILLNLTGDKNEITSFVSSENKDIQSVQFVIKTNDIKIEEPVVIEENPTTELSFWEKFLNLFKLA